MVIGWIGAFMLILAYFLLIHKNLTSRSRRYQALNVVGSLLLAINTLTTKAYPSFITNIIWFLIGLYGIFHIVKHHKLHKSKKR